MALIDRDYDKRDSKPFRYYKRHELRENPQTGELELDPNTSPDNIRQASKIDELEYNSSTGELDFPKKRSDKSNGSTEYVERLKKINAAGRNGSNNFKPPFSRIHFYGLVSIGLMAYITFDRYFGVSELQPIKPPVAVSAVSSAKPQTIKTSPDIASSTAPEVALPKTSMISSLFGSSCDGLPPFEVVAGNGSNYYLKLIDVDTKQEVLTAFVRSGETLSICAPAGSYLFRYASGEKWYGVGLYFGSGTPFSESKQSLQFIKSAYRVSGNTVTLIKTAFGNFPTNSVPASKF